MPISPRWLLGTLAGTAIAASAMLGLAQPQAAQPAGGPNIGQMLVDALATSEGCLGSEALESASGKRVIMAWFKDATAARTWYHHPVHMRMVSMAGVNEHAPLEGIADETPVMVIATITPSDRPEIPGIPMPIKQISIELYTPLPGGAAFGGRMAPAGFHIPNMDGYTEPDAD